MKTATFTFHLLNQVFQVTVRKKIKQEQKTSSKTSFLLKSTSEKADWPDLIGFR